MQLAERLAKNKKRKVSRSISLDELTSAAYVGLIDAASKYDETKISGKYSDPFALYAARRIIGQMTDYLRSCIWLGTRTSPIPMYSLDDQSSSSFGDSSTEDRALSAKDFIKSKSPQPYEALNRLDLSKKVFKKIPFKFRRIVKLYYIKGKTMKEIGKIVGLCESRVSQIIANNIEHLQKVLRDRKEEFFNELEIREE